MSSKHPLVTIITPAYNAERYITRLLDSILDQNYSPIEFIVVDDASTDKTLEIINAYKAKFRSKDITYRTISLKTNRGQAGAINKALKAFSGKYVSFVDADDYLNNGSLKKRVKFLEDNPEFDVVWGKSDEVDLDDEYNRVGQRAEASVPPRDDLFMDALLDIDYNWPPVEYMIRSATFLRHYPDRQIAEYRAGQNIQIFLPIYYRGKVGYIDEALTTIGVHHDSHSRIARSATSQQKRREELHDIIIDTLYRIDMDSQERDNYIRLARFKYEKTLFNEAEIVVRDGMIARLNKELQSHLGVKRSAKLLVGNIKRRVWRKDYN